MKGSFLKSPEQFSEKIDGITPLRVGGIQPFSALDYPNHLSAVIFCQGCSWGCRYCHNAQLQSFIPKKQPKFDWGRFLEFLERRRNCLEGVVFSGGEPILQPHLIDAIHDVKNMGFKIGLHSGGSSARLFNKVLSHVDWVGLDVKAPLEQYPRITGIPNSGIHAWKCVRLLLESGVPYECRTTVHCMLHSKEDIWDIAKNLHQLGARHYVIQSFQEKGCIDKKLTQEKSRLFFDTEFCEKLRSLFETFIIR
jgi:anaerobic ribonucleoside-triphosphate reductase activating protein